MLIYLSTGGYRRRDVRRPPSQSIFTIRNVVAARLCFHRLLWFCSQGGMADTPPGQTHPPPPDTPSQADTPLGRHPPARPPPEMATAAFLFFFLFFFYFSWSFRVRLVPPGLTALCGKSCIRQCWDIQKDINHRAGRAFSDGSINNIIIFYVRSKFWV